MSAAVTIFIFCPQCGVRNRVGSHSIYETPQCGGCGATLPEPKSMLRRRFLRRYGSTLFLICCCMFMAGGFLISGLTKRAVVPAQVCDTPLPVTGQYARYDTSRLVAPLTLRTQSGGYYFIKFQDAVTNRPIMTLFARGGETVQQLMPTGLFVLKYAFGERWCGDAKLFGPTTLVQQTNKLLSFDDEHEVSVDLIRKKNGNLPMRAISSSDF